MTTQEFVVSVSSDHLHYATVDELPNPFGEGSLGTCTIKTVLIVEEGSCTSQECLIWATGPSGTIAPSLQTLLSNSQALCQSDLDGTTEPLAECSSAISR